MNDLGWIDCRKSHPEKDGMLVVVFDPTAHPNVWPAKWDEENSIFESNFDLEHITHWLPLPEAPKSHAWSDGFVAADDDENNYHLTASDYTHNPYQPTSPYTYPDYHCGAPTLQASDWEAGYYYRQFIHQRGVIMLKITQKIGNETIETYL